MVKALKKIDDPTWETRKARLPAVAPKPTKTFEQLSNKEKDDLLRTIALAMGLVKES